MMYGNSLITVRCQCQSLTVKRRAARAPSARWIYQQDQNTKRRFLMQQLRSLEPSSTARSTPSTLQMAGSGPAGLSVEGKAFEMAFEMAVFTRVPSKRGPIRGLPRCVRLYTSALDGCAGCSSKRVHRHFADVQDQVLTGRFAVRSSERRPSQGGQKWRLAKDRFRAAKVLCSSERRGSVRQSAAFSTRA